jgi:Cu2+-exporting ATPase
MISDFKKRFWVSLVLSIPVLLLSPLVQNLFNIKISFTNDIFIIFVFSSIIFFYGGKPFFDGIKRELKAKNPGMMTLVFVAITVAYFYSVSVMLGLKGEHLFWELSTLIDVMLLGHWIEMKSVLGASKTLEKLLKLMPKVARKVEGSSFKDIPVEDLVVGDNVLIKPGEKIPVDGIVIDGTTSINESMLTGEIKPVEKNIHDEVIGGSINGDGSITVEISKIGKDTYLSQIFELIKSVQENKSKTQNIADKSAKWLTIIALSGGTITLFSWFLFSSQTFSFAMERAIAVIVIACPHALGLAIPLVVAFSTSISASKGFLIRNRTAFENARNIKTIIFDKTGTLTLGNFYVSDISVLVDYIKEEELLSLTGSLELYSQHPIAQAIVKKTKKLKKVDNFKSITGKGVEGIIEGKKVKAVSFSYLLENNIEIKSEIEKNDKTKVFVLVDNVPVGIISLDDEIRSEVKDTIAKLKEMKIRTIMITGDNEETAKRIANKIGIDEYFAKVLPEIKAEKIKQILSTEGMVAMVGDGVNDAPALAQADIGIAIGSGTDIALETADIILVRNDTSDIIKIISFAQKTYNKMLQNIFWASGYNIIALPLAGGVLYGFGIVLSPTIGAVFMSLSTIIVAINARLLKF